MSSKDVPAPRDDIAVTHRNYTTPRRSGSFAKLDYDTQTFLKAWTTFMRKELTKDFDMEYGIVYAAKGYGPKVDDCRYTKIGWSRYANDTRINNIQKCDIDVEQSFYTPPFKGAYRAERILHKMFKPVRRDRRLCSCNVNTHHEWFDKDLGLVRHWALTIYLWFRKKPYDSEKRLLKPEWQDALDRWDKSLTTERPVFLEEFLMMGPDFRPNMQLTISLSSSKLSISGQKSKNSRDRRSLPNLDAPLTPSPAPRTITKAGNVPLITKEHCTSRQEIESAGAATNVDDTVSEKENVIPDLRDKSACTNPGSPLNTGPGVQEQLSATEVAGTKEDDRGSQLPQDTARTEDSSNTELGLDELISGTKKLSLHTTQLDSQAVSLKWIKEFHVERGYVLSPQAETSQSIYPAKSNNLTEALVSHTANVLSGKFNEHLPAVKEADSHRSTEGEGAQIDIINAMTELDLSGTIEPQQQDMTSSTIWLKENAPALSPTPKASSDASFGGANDFKYDFSFQPFRHASRMTSPKYSMFGPISTPCPRSAFAHESLQSSIKSIDASTCRPNIDRFSSEGSPALPKSTEHNQVADRGREEVPWCLRLADKTSQINEKLSAQSPGDLVTASNRTSQGFLPAIRGNVFSFEYPHSSKSLHEAVHRPKSIVPSILDKSGDPTLLENPLTLHFAKVWPKHEISDDRKGAADTHDSFNISASFPRGSDQQPEGNLRDGRRRIPWKGRSIVVHFPPPQPSLESDVEDP